MNNTLKIERRKLAELREDPKNSRKHSARNLAAIRGSLARFGQRTPLVVRPDGTVVGGNATLTQMRELGFEECDVVVYHGTDDECVALGIALNRTAELARWDDDVLTASLAELDRDLAMAAEFLESELAQIASQSGGAPAPAAPATPVSRRGDLWVLGSHRLLCGDSTDPVDVARLMNGERAALLATDPPYLVDYDGGNHPQSYRNKHGVRDKSWDSYVDPGTSIEFFAAWLAAWLAACVQNVPVYQWHATRRQVLVEQAWERCGLLVHQTIIWVKSRPVLTRSHYMWQHEPCFYGWPRSNAPAMRPPPNEKTVWQVDQAGEQDGIHLTQKPVELFKRPIVYHTKPGDVVVEPFSGSGTQIIAAEELCRRCFAMEIAPEFVDVAVERWQAATGGAAVLDGDGRAYAEVARERLGHATGVVEDLATNTAMDPAQDVGLGASSAPAGDSPRGSRTS